MEKVLSGLRKCPECQVMPGQPHESGCDVEVCSSCGRQRLSCDCEDHDSIFARWTGIWPGKAEAKFIGIDLNDIWKYEKAFFIKP